MPTRRTMGLVIITVIAVRPVFGMLRLWSKKTLDESNSGTVKHGVAEVITVIV